MDQEQREKVIEKFNKDEENFHALKNRVNELHQIILTDPENLEAHSELEDIFEELKDHEDTRRKGLN